MKRDQISTLCGTLTIIALFCAFLIGNVSCNRGGSTNLIGVSKKPSWEKLKFPKELKKMVYVPSGSLHIGPTDQDISETFIQRPKSYAIPGFYMSEYEVSNKEYRTFVYWVRDSLAHTLLNHFVDATEGTNRIDWKQKIDWSDETLEPLFLTSGVGERQLDISKLVIEYVWYDWKAKMNPDNRFKENFIKGKKVNIYPVLSIEESEPYVDDFPEDYFMNPNYDNYPVVGISYYQAMGYCDWLTQKLIASNPGRYTEDIRLPTEYEWMYAAQGGRDYIPYPWGYYYSSKNKKNTPVFYCNGGVSENRQSTKMIASDADGFKFTAPVDAFPPNDYGVHQIIGNVAEWTSSDGDEGYKIVKGGSWVDTPEYLIIDTSRMEKIEAVKPYLGFRPVITFLGRSVSDF